ncbi:DUF397 domain-containing protein [Streptomyces sp. NPDC055366]
MATAQRRILTTSQPRLRRIQLPHPSNGAPGLDGVTGVVPVRDSKNPKSPALVVPDHGWDAFVNWIKH